MGIQEGTDEEERDADPGQDEAVAKVSLPRVPGVIQDVLPVEGEDEASGKDRETCGDSEHSLLTPVHRPSKIKGGCFDVVHSPANA